MSVGCAVFLLGAFVRVGRLRSRRGLSAIRGFVELLLDSIRGANSLVDSRGGGMPGIRDRARGGVRPKRLVSLHGRVRDTNFLVGLTWGSGGGWTLPGGTRAELTA